MHKTKGQKTFIYSYSGVVLWLCQFQKMMPALKKTDFKKPTQRMCLHMSASIVLLSRNYSGGVRVAS